MKKVVFLIALMVFEFAMFSGCSTQGGLNIPDVPAPVIDNVKETKAQDDSSKSQGDSNNTQSNTNISVLPPPVVYVPLETIYSKQEAHPSKNQPLAEQPQKKPAKPPERRKIERGKKIKTPKPSEYGNVIMNNFSVNRNIAAVVFPHWLHRSKYTCRVCHIDIGFAMEANETKVTGDDIKNGDYCGACHNGKISFASAARNEKGLKSCYRCHSYGEDRKPDIDFNEFKAKLTLPEAQYGNRINWEAAEEEGFIKLKDEVHGKTFKDKPRDPNNPLYKRKAPEDKELFLKDDEGGKLKGIIDNIIFSHKKHTVWNGCEVCHPDLFIPKIGKNKYLMEDLFEGKYCGFCHDKVAFPNSECRRCHTLAKQ